MELELTKFIKNIKYRSSWAKIFQCFADETHEDFGQELFCQIWVYLNNYDESKSSFCIFLYNRSTHVLTQYIIISLDQNLMCSTRFQSLLVYLDFLPNINTF